MMIAHPPLAFPVAVAALAARAVVAAALVHVRQQRQLARTLDGPGDLVLVAAAGAGDPARADLALLGDELAQRADVLVVDLLDVVAAVLARLAPAATGTALLVSPAHRLCATTLFHLNYASLCVFGMGLIRTECRRRHRNPRRQAQRAGSPLRERERRCPVRLR